MRGMQIKYPAGRVEPLELGKTNPMPVLEEATKQLDDYWISAGTLLGLYRDNGFIPHDTDLDVEVIGESPKLNDSFELVVEAKHMEAPMQTAYRHKDTGVIFDIYHFWEEGADLINISLHGKMTMPAKFVQPLGEFKGFKAPNNIEKYLEIRYGDWQTPKQYKVSWEQDANNLS